MRQILTGKWVASIDKWVSVRFNACLRSSKANGQRKLSPCFPPCFPLLPSFFAFLLLITLSPLAPLLPFSTNRSPCRRTRPTNAAIEGPLRRKRQDQSCNQVKDHPSYFPTDG